MAVDNARPGRSLAVAGDDQRNTIVHSLSAEMILVESDDRRLRWTWQDRRPGGKRVELPTVQTGDGQIGGAAMGTDRLLLEHIEAISAVAASPDGARRR